MTFCPFPNIPAVAETPPNEKGLLPNDGAPVSAWNDSIGGLGPDGCPKNALVIGNVPGGRTPEPFITEIAQG